MRHIHHLLPTAKYMGLPEGVIMQIRPSMPVVRHDISRRRRQVVRTAGVQRSAAKWVAVACQGHAAVEDRLKASMAGGAVVKIPVSDLDTTLIDDLPTI